MSREVRIQFRKGRRPWRGRLRVEHWFRLVASNGKVLCHSEGYPDERNCRIAAQIIHNAVIVYDMTPPKV